MMKRKKYHIVRLLKLSVVLGILILIFAILTSMSYNETGKELVEDAIYERQDAMRMYFASEIDYWEAAAMLEKVEAGNLLEKDKQYLKDYFRTDIEKVEECEILNTELTLMSSDLVCATVEILWETEGLEGTEETSAFYSIILENQGDSFKLVHFF